ncbi:23S rRNA (uracil5-)-methyltransferase RumA, putative, partial [Acanthamoeba castellanii str. Neff]
FAAYSANAGDASQFSDDGGKKDKEIVFVAKAVVDRLDELDPSQGVVHHEGVKIEVFGALPGEEISFTRPVKKRNATLVEVMKASEHRALPRCGVYGRCGGCSLMHMTHEKQLEVKHQLALDVLRQEGVEPAEVLPPLHAQQYGYRHSARPNVRHLEDREDRVGGKVLVGFRHKWVMGSQPVDRCAVLAEPINSFFQDAADVINRMSVRDKVPTVEVMMGDTEKALLLRHLSPLSSQDKRLLTEFARAQGFHLYTQAEGIDSIKLFYSPTGFVPSAPPVEVSAEPFSPLFYTLPNHGVKIHFNPTDFIQVNSEVNRKLVDQAIEFLELTKKDRVLDLFCGLGNFTLPVARYAKSVMGVEWQEYTVQKARTNALISGLTNVTFHSDDLLNPKGLRWLKPGKVQFNKMVIDPPRSGAIAVLERLFAEHGMRPDRIVYVSCNPETLARDLAFLQTQGYATEKMRTADMFPNTNHIESIALLQHIEPNRKSTTRPAAAAGAQ